MQSLKRLLIGAVIVLAAALAVYYLASAEIPKSTAWKEAANSPWTERMRPHFRNHLRIVSRRYRRGAA